MKKRSEIKECDKWDLSALYESKEAWEADVEKLKKALDTFPKYQGTLAQSSASLLSYMQFADEIDEILENVYVYSNQKLHENLADSESQEAAQKAQSIMIEISGASAFVQPEILSIPKEKMEQFLKEEPGLQPFEKNLRDLMRQKEHVLDARSEQILSMTNAISQAPQDTYSMFLNADARFAHALDSEGKAHSVSNASFVKLMESSDRTLRKNAFSSMYDFFGSFRNTLAANFAANLKQADFYAKVRGYSSARAMYLDDAAIPEQVYDNLIDTVHESLPLMYQYVAKRKQILGVEKLHMYDVYTPLVKDVTYQVSYDEAKEMVKEGLAPMGSEYLSHLQEGFDGRWIDVYENEGKRSGAYSWGTYTSHPYVLLNYQGTLNEVFTIAHEMGHALHSYYSNHNQPHAMSGYKIFVAEVASTCNEALLIRHLIGHAKDEKQKKYLINHFLEQFKATLFRQTMFAEFERDMHAKYAAGEAVNAQTLCEHYYELNRKYFGPDMVVDREIEMEWARIPHFYTPFYVYQYATGFSAAIALSNRILKLGEQGVSDYMKFLKGGSSKDPLELLKMAGVDMSSKEPIKEALKVFEELLLSFE